MRKILPVLTLLWTLSVSAQPGYDVFQTVSKYLIQGNSDALSAWFAPDVDMAVISESADVSRAQARRMLEKFFDAYTPQSFTVIHSAGRENMKYVIGELSAGGESFAVTIFINSKADRNEIQQFKIERR